MTNAHKPESPKQPLQKRATQFDGNPNPEPADNDLLSPKDDTPQVLEKKEGPTHAPRK